MEKHPFNSTINDSLTSLGDQLHTLRIRQNLDQITLAERAGIGLSALKNLEGGHGATLTTLVKTLRALGRADWLETLSPTVSVSPLQMLKTKRERVRASKPRTKRDAP